MITGAELQNRVVIQGETKRRRETPEDQGAADRLDLLEQRIAQARTIKPSGKDLHCEDCFTRGRDAVLKLLAG